MAQNPPVPQILPITDFLPPHDYFMG